MTETELMLAFLTNPLWLLFLTLLCYWVMLQVRQKTGFLLFNPLLLTSILLICYLKIAHIDFTTYNQGGQYLSFWLQPAVVCLAIPLFKQWQTIKQQWLTIILCEAVGSLVGIVSGIWLARLLGASEVIQCSIAAKSVTAPIFLEVTKSIAGIAELGFAGVMTAGILGQMLGFMCLRWVRVNNAISQGLAMGTASHALGVAGAWERSPVLAAYATVGLILNGILTAVFTPIVLQWLF